MPLLVPEARTDSAEELLEDDRGLVAWWATEVECISAIARQERHEGLSADDAESALGVLASLAEAWVEVHPSEPQRRAAGRLLRVHDLRAADALQLAAAIEAAEANPAGLPLVTLDARLAAAARCEGFSVLVPAGPPP